MHNRLLTLLLIVLPFVAVVTAEIAEHYRCYSAPDHYGKKPGNCKDDDITACKLNCGMMCGLGIFFEFNSAWVNPEKKCECYCSFLGQ
ncbi:hypothetical protein PTMSG1_06250 [Pyrenophora teres f. maculata]|nr:hypothetical protein PTMSG1_06250 [Pyrenophora teres f. maculata]